MYISKCLANVSSYYAVAKLVGMNKKKNFRGIKMRIFLASHAEQSNDFAILDKNFETLI